MKVAKRFNLNSQSVRWRINRGETLLDVVNNPVRRPGGKAKIHIEYKGQIYTVRELSEKYNISSDIIRVRWHKGWTAGKSGFDGIREGTLISALITGTIARYFLKHLSKVDENGNLVFYPLFREKNKDVQDCPEHKISLENK